MLFHSAQFDQLGILSLLLGAKAPETHCAHLVTPCDHREIGLTCQYGTSAQVHTVILPQLEKVLGPQSPAHSIYQSCRENTNQRMQKGCQYQICSE